MGDRLKSGNVKKTEGKTDHIKGIRQEKTRKIEEKTPYVRRNFALNFFLYSSKDAISLSETSLAPQATTFWLKHTHLHCTFCCFLAIRVFMCNLLGQLAEYIWSKHMSLCLMQWIFTYQPGTVMLYECVTEEGGV